MQVIGETMVEYIMQGNKFKEDLVNKKNRDQLVTSFGDMGRINQQMSNPAWLD